MDILERTESSYTDDLEEKATTFKPNLCQFIVDGDSFFPCSKTVDVLPEGYYKIRKDYSRGIFFKKLPIKLNKLVLLESSEFYNEIVNDITTFWDSKEKYEKRGKLHKRNILLHSAPGMGKTSLINLIVEELITHRNGFVLSISDESDIINFNDGMSILRTIMPNRPIIVIIEDIDNFIGNKNTIETELLNILDGIGTFENVLIVATTNYPETLTDRYINRPSRFNRVIEIPYPNAEVRREFIIKTNLAEDLEKINLDEWVERTEGFSIDLIKELCVSVFICGNTQEKSFSLIDTISKRKIVKNVSNKNSVGFFDN